jgi:structural maintenance of chromosome 2
MAAAGARLRELTAAVARGGKIVNRKVMAMFDKAESEFVDVVNKKRIIEADKAKIESVIAELDAKKDEALKATFHKVSTDFSSIFSSLLPGAEAKVSPPARWD